MKHETNEMVGVVDDILWILSKAAESWRKEIESG